MKPVDTTTGILISCPKEMAAAFASDPENCWPQPYINDLTQCGQSYRVFKAYGTHFGYGNEKCKPKTWLV